LDANALISTWKTSSVGSTGKFMLTFGVEDSWALMYNMYLDKWLGLDTVDQEVSAMNLPHISAIEISMIDL
jgi:hypothetical protein